MLINQNEIQSISGKKMLLNVENYQGNTILDWVEENKEEIESFISQEGALLIRGLNIDGDNEFGSILKKIFGEDLENYEYRSTPRTELKNKIYTATEYHASEVIPQHNENGYFSSWPMRIGFLCETPALKNGNTPISDSRVAYQEIPKEIREEFERKKIMYVRNYSDIDLPWQEVFQTSDKNSVEKFCKDNGVNFEWTPEGLKTTQTNQASIAHPLTNEKLWFNQAHLFHVSNLDQDLQEALLELLGENNLPRHCFFGDGTAIDPISLDIIRKVYEKTKFSFEWKKNDLLLLDNMLYTHGREPYEGPRKVLVGMARKFQA